MLENIQSPEDIKKYSPEALNRLAREIRARLIQVTSQNGGHLAPNLGVVELTLALHKVFQAPSDQIVWDVGHQSYVHKLLTGRNDGFFDTLRTYGGMSGFPKRHESPYDTFGTGHASTSISAATGFALARDLRGERHNVVAVIGDGAFTGGMVYEAMNFAGHLGLKLMVVLNDNEMSIEKNVGGLSNTLTRMRTDPNYQRAKEDVDATLKRIPTVGPRMADMADRMKDTMKFLLVPGSFFEELGFKYYGPVNGHDVEALVRVMNNAKKLDRPVLIHAITQKGRGYWPAERRPDRFHGTGAFEIKTGEAPKKKAPAYTDVFAQTLIRLAKDDPRICAITAAMGSGTGVAKFREVYPKRSFDVGIAEEHATTMAAALALAGQKPVLALYSTFMQRGFDQIIHDAAIQEAPMVLALDRAGLVGEDGPTHHGVFDLSYLRIIPHLTAMAPKDERELQDMLYSALKYDSLTAIRYPRGGGPGVAMAEDDEPLNFIPKGVGEWLHHGSDVVLVAIGSMVQTALAARDILMADGYSVGVVNARFVKPLDEEILAQAFREAPFIVTCEENMLAGGFGSAILEWAAREGYVNKVHNVGIGDQFIEAGSVKALKADLGLDAEGLARQVAVRLQAKEALAAEEAHFE